MTEMEALKVGLMVPGGVLVLVVLYYWLFD